MRVAQSRPIRASAPPPRAAAALTLSVDSSRQHSQRRGLVYWLLHLPRLLLSYAIFGSFFLVGGLICIFAALRLLFGRPPPRAQRRYRWAMNRGFERFMAMLKALRLLDYRLPPRPADHPEGAYLLIANHPGLLDVALLLAACPEAVCLVKAEWYRFPLLGPLLRLGDHIPGPGIDLGLDASSTTSETPVLERIEEKLREGVPVVVFPEGTRSPRRGLRRFHRGGIEAAVRADVPVVQVFLDLDGPFLAKGQRLWELPARPRYLFEWLGRVDTDDVQDSRELTRACRRAYQTRMARLPEGT